MTTTCTADDLGPAPESAPRTTSRGLRLILVRHGESRSNIEGTIAGERTCAGLTDHGRRQARAVAEYLATEQIRFDISAVYSTAVRRAVETAEPIAHALAIPLRPEFPYVDYGVAEGRRWHEVTTDPTQSASPDNPLAPGADSWATSASRTGRMLDTLADLHHGDTIVLVCHRETILATAQHFQRIPPTLTYASAEVDYTSVTEWQHRPRTANPGHWRWVLVRHNDTRHLPAANPGPLGT